MKQIGLFEDATPKPQQIRAADQVVLRQYQNDAVDAVFGEWGNGHRSTLVVLPTGTGKSVVFSEVIRRLLK